MSETELISIYWSKLVRARIDACNTRNARVAFRQARRAAHYGILLLAHGETI
jgi:hypothetical protein